METAEKNKDIRIVFMGTPDFAAQQLNVLSGRFQVTLVVTQPDRPKGRGKKVSPSPVGELAERLGIPTLKPEILKNSVKDKERIRAERPDIIVVVAYGQILTEDILSIPRLGCINLHASLLPEYRGAAPIQAAILDGREITGNTTMLMDKGLDTGDMLLRSEVRIPSDADTGILHDLLMEDGGDLLVRTVEGLYAGTIISEPQDDSKATYVKKFSKDLSHMDFMKDPQDIVNLVRGMSPYPTAYCMYRGEKLKVGRAEVVDSHHSSEPGTILSVTKEGISVATATGAVLFTRIQMPGKKMVDVRDFLNGNSLDVGTVLQ